MSALAFQDTPAGWDRRCFSKQGYRTEVRARFAGFVQLRRSLKIPALYVYACDICGDWHLTKKPNVLRPITSTAFFGQPAKKNPAVVSGGANARNGHTAEENYMLSVLTKQSETPPPLTATRPLNQIIREGRMEIDGALAARILEEARYDRQRNIRTDQVKLLSSKLTRRVFHGSGQVSFGLINGALKLVNGQHRMTAVAETGIPADFHIAIEPVSSEAQLHSLYWTFDRGVATRSPHDVLTAAGVADTAGISKHTAAAVYNAMPLIMNRFQRPRYQVDPVSARCDDARLKAASQWWKTAATYERIVDPSYGALRTKLHNAQVLAVALVTLKHQPERATEFWSGLAANDGLRVGDPRKALIDRLFDKSHVGSNTATAGYVAVAWNKWFEGEKARILRFTDKSTITIAGTPFNGRGR